MRMQAKIHIGLWPMLAKWWIALLLRPGLVGDPADDSESRLV